jgi:hypothetical protein
MLSGQWLVHLTALPVTVAVVAEKQSAHVVHVIHVADIRGLMDSAKNEQGREA